MRRNSLISSRPTRALRDRPATDTRLLSNPFPTRRWKVHRPHAANPSLGSFPRLRPLNGALTPGYRPGGRPDTLGSPEAIAPRLDSPVASFGTPPYHGDGKEDTPDPLRTVGSVWGSYPFQDSPVFPLGDPCSPRDGREFALPSLRMVERLPHTDRPQGETPSSPADMRVWRSLAPRPLRPGHGPSIAYPTLPTAPTFYTVIPDPDRESIPGAGPLVLRLSKYERGVAHTRLSCLASYSHPLLLRHSCGGQSLPLRRQGNSSLRNNHLRSRNSRHPLPFHQYQTRGRHLRQGAGASFCFYLLLSLKGPKGEGDQGGEGSPVGLGASPAPREIPRNPFRRRSIKTATSSINVQSIFNQMPHHSLGAPPPSNCPQLLPCAILPRAHFQAMQEGIEQLKHGTRDRNGTPTRR